VLTRGATVIVVMSVLLWLTGFIHPDELRALNTLRTRRAVRPLSAGTDTTELAGEIVAVDVPDEPLWDDKRLR
jgi:hypothetical protein